VVPDRAGEAGAHAFESSRGDGARRAVSTEDAAIVQFETDAGAVGSVVVSQVSAGRKNRLWIELDGSEEALAFDQEQPEELWCGSRESLTILRRDPAALSPGAARLATLPAGHPQGYADCFDAFVADVYEAVRGGAVPEGTPTFADGLRAAQITEAVLASSRDGKWVDVEPSREPQAVAS
jgi:predicted dehydrogenase